MQCFIPGFFFPCEQDDPWQGEQRRTRAESHVSPNNTLKQEQVVVHAHRFLCQQVSLPQQEEEEANPCPSSH